MFILLPIQHYRQCGLTLGSEVRLPALRSSQTCAAHTCGEQCMLYMGVQLKSKLQHSATWRAAACVLLATPVFLLPSRSSSDVEIKEFKRVGLQRRAWDLSSREYFVCVCVCVCGRDIRCILLHQYDNIWEVFSLLLFLMLPVTSLQ